MSPENETGIIVAVVILAGIGISICILAASAYIMWSKL